MIEIENHTTRYFRAPQDYFWHWTDGGTVIEWRSGATICYREDLISILQQLSNKGLPPLSPLLLLLSACKRPLGTQEIFFLYRNFFGDKDGDDKKENQSIKPVLDEAINFLKIVAELPENLRTGNKRVHLLHEVFESGSFTIANRQLQDALQELNSGRLDKTVFNLFSVIITREEFMDHLGYLSNAFRKFPTVHQLVLKLRTGLDQLPEAFNAEIPGASALNIFDQLLQDPTTIGIAKLARRLIATLNIPMQSKGSSDQSFGGISDITNRGNYDKLLLSELAYDDELLMARLVNNEALYFRREQPPEQPKMQRIILMDTTIKMWGTSRVFALAAGLASAQHNKHAEGLQAYTLGGNHYTAVNLNVKAGIVQALEMLDHALHCGKSLEALIQSVTGDNQNEIIFITDARLLHSPAFHASLTIVKHALSFVITVTNNGEINLYEYINGVSKQISSAKIDMDELLSVPSANIVKVKTGNNHHPLFLSYTPSPLYFAPNRIKISPGRTFFQEGIGAVAINEAQRIMFVNQEGKGMIEAFNYIEKGVYTFGISDCDTSIKILVSNQERNLLKLYSFNLSNFETSCQNLSDKISFFSKAVFRHDYLYMQTNNAVLVYDYTAEILIDKKEHQAFADIFNQALSTFWDLKKGISSDKLILDYESIFYRVKEMHINSKRQLVVGKHVLYAQKMHISFVDHPPTSHNEKKAKRLGESLNLVQNKNVGFNVWVWEDGSEAIVDSRGLLHLKSANTAIPEITIVMVLSRTSACWASDGTAAGSTYFINEKITRIISADDFHNLYIQKYIDHIISK